MVHVFATLVWNTFQKYSDWEDTFLLGNDRWLPVSLFSVPTQIEAVWLMRKRTSDACPIEMRSEAYFSTENNTAHCGWWWWWLQDSSSRNSSEIFSTAVIGFRIRRLKWYKYFIYLINWIIWTRCSFFESTKLQWKHIESLWKQQQ